jgi:hypothetical protein
VSPVRYELGFYSLEGGSLHSHHRQDLKSYIALTGWTLVEKCFLSCVVRTGFLYVRFEFFTAVTMKNGVFWVVTPCGSCKNRCLFAAYVGC